ncbi:EcoRII N-terminal effector-binding domain-containing protein [Devosia riboflavina]
MSIATFRKKLSANDVGQTGAHQGGLLIPKGEKDLLAMLPSLDRSVKNPDAWIDCADESGHVLKLRFVYYNNKLHDPGGTRNEYRITHLTGWFRDVGAREGDELEISRTDLGHYEIAIRSAGFAEEPVEFGLRVRLSAWRRVH